MARPPSRRHSGLKAVILAVVMAAGAPALAHPPAQLSVQGDQDVAEDIMHFRKTLIETVARKDAAALRTMYAEKFTHIHTSAKMDGRDARIVSLMAGDPVIETAPATNLSTAVHAGGWAAIMTGTGPIKSLADGKVYAVHWTAFYVRTEKGWQIAASHATRGKEIKP
ncbi:MAG: nuclear transport factor 2 family protein [Beijerinckiaceae bacterium]